MEIALKKQADELIDAARGVIYTPEYAQKASKAEVLGCLLALVLEHDGQQIFTALQEAMTEANYHAFCSIMHDQWAQHTAECGEAADSFCRRVALDEIELGFNGLTAGDLSASHASHQLA